MAANLLAGWEPDRFWRALLTLDYAEAGAKADAAWSLGRLRQKPELCVPALTQSLNDTNADVRQEAAAALGKFGIAAIGAAPQLIKLLDDREAGVRTAATNALHQIQPGSLQTNSPSAR